MKNSKNTIFYYIIVEMEYYKIESWRIVYKILT